MTVLEILAGILTKIQNLLTKANNATGKNDADLATAIDRLIDGQGGSSPTETLTITSNNLATYNTNKKIDISNYKYLVISLDSYTDDW